MEGLILLKEMASQRRWPLRKTLGEWKKTKVAPGKGNSVNTFSEASESLAGREFEAGKRSVVGA